MTNKNRKREIKFCDKCQANKQHDAGNCRACYEKVRRDDPETKAALYARNAEYRKNNKHKRRTYEKNRLDTNPNAKIANRFRNLVNKLMIRGFGSATELLGCSFEELKVHIESQWKDGMTWSNWSNSGWQVDHIEPIVSFDLTDPEQQKIAFHYSNLQPLWKTEHDVKTKEDMQKHVWNK